MAQTPSDSEGEDLTAGGLIVAYTYITIPTLPPIPLHIPPPIPRPKRILNHGLRLAAQHRERRWYTGAAHPAFARAAHVSPGPRRVPRRVIRRAAGSFAALSVTAGRGARGELHAWMVKASLRYLHDPSHFQAPHILGAGGYSLMNTKRKVAKHCGFTRALQFVIIFN